MSASKGSAGFYTQSQSIQIRLIKQLFICSFFVLVVSGLLIVGPWRYLSEEQPTPPTWYINTTYYLFPVLPLAIYGLFSLLLIPRIKAGTKPSRRYFHIAFILGLLANISALGYLQFNQNCGTSCGQTSPSFIGACFIVLLLIPPLCIYPKYLMRRFDIPSK